jgi:hypothetical protein
MRTKRDCGYPGGQRPIRASHPWAPEWSLRWSRRLFAECLAYRVVCPPMTGCAVNDQRRWVGFVPRDLCELQSLGHYGIVGILERAVTAGGVLNLASAPGSGAVVTVRVPLCAPRP